jgi:hypothetical protein
MRWLVDSIETGHTWGLAGNSNGVTDRNGDRHDSQPVYRTFHTQRVSLHDARVDFLVWIARRWRNVRSLPARLS